MEAITTSSSQSTSSDRWQMLGGDRFYTFARWVILLLLFVISNLLTDAPIWPISGESSPTVITLWSYALFGVLTTLALFVPPFQPLLNLAYLLDIAFISLLTLLNGEQHVIFFPLYLLPLISSALRQSPMVSLMSGIAASFCYVTALLIWSQVLGRNVVLQPLDYVSLGLRVVTLSFVPWLTSGLAERWSANNRRRVEEAQQLTEKSLRDAQAYRDQMRSLYEVAYALSTTMDYRHVLSSTLRESRKLVPYTAGMVLLSSGNPDELYIAAGESLHPSDQNRRITIGRGDLVNALRSPDPRLVTDISRELDLSLVETLRTCKNACLVPLRAGLRTYGLMLVASDRADAFSHEQLDMLNALANYAIIALQNAQLIFDLKEERSKLLSKEEEVRHQLARDLHDGPAQALAAITMNIEFIKRLLDRDPTRVIEELDKLSALAKRTTYEVRTMLFELRPLVLETQGLRVTLEQYLERFRANSKNTEIVLEADETDDIELETKTEGTLFNIIQEALNNALKHARAEHIWVRLRRQGTTLVATVEDNGIGFDKAKIMRSYEKRGSFGLLNIDERARLVGGAAEMESTPGKGTTVRVVVPLD
ncbi:MAG: histidine kinase [Chloroflexales bacterium]|nr:histidine kinase [Chloroflexales bacterium]